MEYCKPKDRKAWFLDSDLVWQPCGDTSFDLPELSFSGKPEDISEKVETLRNTAPLPFSISGSFFKLLNVKKLSDDSVTIKLCLVIIECDSKPELPSIGKVILSRILNYQETFEEWVISKIANSVSEDIDKEVLNLV